jgi:P27 family predicted phage terminase small subunit
MANPRKPTQMKIIQGTFRKDRAPKKEPQPEKVLEIPRPPSHLSKYAKKAWKYIAGELVEKGILTIIDTLALEACCEAYGQYRLAYEAVFRPVDPETGKKGKRTFADYMRGRNSQTMPEYVSMKGAWATFKSYLTEFGMTPASRTKLEISEKRGEETDPMERLFHEA